VDAGAPTGDLFAYIQEEWGGQSYKLTVLALDGTPLQEHRVRIAGPPRAEGRRLRRSDWDGDDERQAPPQPQQTAGALGGDALALMQLIMTEARENRNGILDAVQAIQNQSASSVKDMLTTMAANQENAQARASFAAQLQEFSEGAQALNQVRDEIAATAPQADGEPAPGALAGFATEKFAETMIERFTRPQQPPTRRTTGTAPQPPNGHARPPIPDAE
jgi:hypothetical protein